MKKSKLALWILFIIAAFILGLFLRPTKEVTPVSLKRAKCEGESEAREEALSVFCTLIRDQLSPEQCIRTDYAKKVGSEMGRDWIERCTYKDMLPADTQNAVPTSSKDFGIYHNVNPIEHL